MTQHPYRTLPSYCFWRASIAETPLADVDPVVAPKFTITRTDRVATAGSCFAQHIARHLSSSGFNYFVTEKAHPRVWPSVAKDFGYGLFTARYGNIYTSRQLLQLLRRAYGLFTPIDDVWVRDDGRRIDPFRPQIQPDGFICEAEYRVDRAQHLAAVRRAVEELDVFVFTLGLTEVWLSREDGAAYPLCPGVAGGVFTESRHMFVNLKAAEIVADMNAAFGIIRSKNPKARFILTVSPVPLVATATGRSVLAATTYSKSVLRVACEEIAADYDDVAYFPSYEIITGNYNRGRYFASDLRSVTEEGVEHVMRLFMKHYAGETNKPDAGEPNKPAAIDQPTPDEPTHAVKPIRDSDQEIGQLTKAIHEVIAAICDEESLDRPSVEQDVATVSLSLTVHIGMVGDKESASCWVRSTQPGRDIQGFRIDHHGKGAGDLWYRARLADGRWSDWVGLGNFVGTRGQAQDLTGFSVRLGDTWRDAFDLELLGAFRGEPDNVVVLGSGDCVAESASGRLSEMRILLRAKNLPVHRGDGVRRSQPVSPRNDAALMPQGANT
jgi:GSCFA family